MPASTLSAYSHAKPMAPVLTEVSSSARSLRTAFNKGPSAWLRSAASIARRTPWDGPESPEGQTDPSVSCSRISLTKLVDGPSWTPSKLKLPGNLDFTILYFPPVHR